MKRGGPLKRTTPLKRSPMKRGTTPIRQQSPKAKNVAAKRKTLREGYHENGLYHCECCPVRGKDPELWTDLHERVLRSRGGDATDEANVIRLCRDCHEYIHKNPEWATANNFMAHAEPLPKPSSN